MSISCTQYCFPDQLCLWLRLWGSPTIFLASSPFFSCKPPPSCLPWALQSFFLPLFISPSMIKAFSLCILDDLIDESQRGGGGGVSPILMSKPILPSLHIGKGISKAFFVSEMLLWRESWPFRYTWIRTVRKMHVLATHHPWELARRLQEYFAHFILTFWLRGSSCAIGVSFLYHIGVWTDCDVGQFIVACGIVICTQVCTNTRHLKGGVCTIYHNIST